jgi:hypothetical protein
VPETKFTSEPWYDNGYRIYVPPNADEGRLTGRVIVEYKHVVDFNPADAPLITAAPKLYAALLSVCPYCNGDLAADSVNERGYHPRPGANQEDECYLTPDQRDVLAEARGEHVGDGYKKVGA